MMLILAYLLAASVGISLGLIGGGGSILMVPILVYMIGIDPTLATSYSLFIVGATAVVGTINNYRKGLVSLQTAILFGLTSVFTVFITRKWIIPQIPEVLFNIGSVSVTKSMATMLLFALLMLMASVAMIRKGDKEQVPDQRQSLNYSRLFFYGILIGLVTGFLGAGGGFLIVPVLVLIFGLSMKEAVGTSLLIIAMNSLIGFAGDLGHYTINWKLLFSITAIAVAGIFVGGALAKKIDGNKLKKAFGWFVLLMGLYVILNEILG